MPTRADDELEIMGAAYARQAVESVSAFDWTHHRLCNVVIVIDESRRRRRAASAHRGGALRPRIRQGRDRMAHHEATHENPLHRQGRMKS